MLPLRDPRRRHRARRRPRRDLRASSTPSGCAPRFRRLELRGAARRGSRAPARRSSRAPSTRARGARDRDDGPRAGAADAQRREDPPRRRRRARTGAGSSTAGRRSRSPPRTPTRALPALATIVAWRSCEHSAPVFEGDILSTEVAMVATSRAREQDGRDARRPARHRPRRPRNRRAARAGARLGVRRGPRLIGE